MVYSQNIVIIDSTHDFMRVEQIYQDLIKVVMGKC
jgi:hypothetical protein